MMRPRRESVRSGDGWTIVETADLLQTPGAHDIGARLGIADGTIALVILRAAEQWAVDPDTLTDVTAILHREGHMLVELGDGSTQHLTSGWLQTGDRSVAALVNVGVGIAKAFVIRRFTDATRGGGRER